MSPTYVIDGRKSCTRCGQQLEVAAFPANRRVSTGLSSWCRTCHNAASAEWRARTGYAERDRQRKR